MEHKNYIKTGLNSQHQIFFIASLLLSFVIAFFPVWKSLVFIWFRSDDYSHGFFIVPICLFIIWQKKGRLSKIDIRSSNYGFILILFSLLLYLVAYFAEIKTVAPLAMILFLSGAIIYLFGYRILNELLFPLFLLLFMIPVPLNLA